MDLKPVIKYTPVGSGKCYIYALSFPQNLLAPDGQDLGEIVFYVGRGTWCKPPAI